MNDRPPDSTPPTERLRTLRDALLTGLVERDVAVRLALLAALAGEHLLMLGPPGTAKSLIARRLHLAFDDSTYFERLLTRFSVPEELFGPLSIKGLEEDRYHRLTTAYLPSASIGFLDEIFKANSAILNALLTLLNEREFDNGAVREETPLLAVVGASNELPESEDLAALYDRFLLRLHVGPVSADGFRDLLRLRGHSEPDVPSEARLTADEVRALQQAAMTVEVPGDVEGLLIDLRSWCFANEMAVSDRRWRKIVKLLQVSALTNGRSAVSMWDCWLIQHCLWDDPADRQAVYDWYADRVGASGGIRPDGLTAMVNSWEGKLHQDQERREERRDEYGRLLYQQLDGSVGTDPHGAVLATSHNGEHRYLRPPVSLDHHDSDRTNRGEGYTVEQLDRLTIQDGHGGSVRFRDWKRRSHYLASEQARLTERGTLRPAMEPLRHKDVYVDDALRQLDALRVELDAYELQLRVHVETLEADIRGHLWVTEDFIVPAARSLQETSTLVARLRDRLEAVRSGFDALPREVDYKALPEVPTQPPAGPLDPDEWGYAEDACIGGAP